MTDSLREIVVGRNVTSHRSIALTNLPGYKHKKAECLSCSLSQGNSKERQAGKWKNLLNHPVLSLPAGWWLLAVPCRVLGGVFPGATPVFCVSDRGISQGRAQGKTHF